MAFSYKILNISLSGCCISAKKGTFRIVLSHSGRCAVTCCTKHSNSPGASHLTRRTRCPHSRPTRHTRCPHPRPTQHPRCPHPRPTRHPRCPLIQGGTLCAWVTSCTCDSRGALSCHLVRVSTATSNHSLLPACLIYSTCPSTRLCLPFNAREVVSASCGTIWASC